ncbi:MAG: Maf family protein [Burkholderiaceae bacterium]
MAPISTVPIWLASRSPRRQEILSQMQVCFELLLPDDPQAAEALETVRPHEAPDQYVARVTQAKLSLAIKKVASQSLPSRTILAADTTVALGGKILGKPADAEQCREMIDQLSGRSHRVLTAVAVARGQKIRHKVQVSRITFARIKADEIDAYAQSGDGLDKAGGYGIQGYAACFIRRIEGSYSGIMGLPIYETRQLLGR